MEKYTARYSLLDLIAHRVRKAEEFRYKGRYNDALDELFIVRKILEGEKEEFRVELSRLDDSAIITWKIIVYSETGRNHYLRKGRSFHHEKCEWAEEVWKKAINLKTLSNLHISLEPLVLAFAGMIMTADEKKDAELFFWQGSNCIGEWYYGLRNKDLSLPDKGDLQRSDRLYTQLKLAMSYWADDKCMDDKRINEVLGLWGDLTLEASEFSGEICYELGILFAHKAEECDSPEQEVSFLIKSNIFFDLVLECLPEKMVWMKESAEERIKKNKKKKRKLQERNPNEFALVVRDEVKRIMSKLERDPLGTLSDILNLSTFAKIPLTPPELAYIKLHTVEAYYHNKAYHGNMEELRRELHDNEWLTPEQKQKLDSFRREESGKETDR